MVTASRKYFWFGLVFVFLVGLFGGAFLVLRSTITHGELANSTPVSQGKSSDELLQELLKLNADEKNKGQENTDPENKNITDDLFSATLSQNDVSDAGIKKIQSNDFMVNTVIPFLNTNQIDLFPIIPSSVLNIVPDSSANNKKYFKDTADTVNALGQEIGRLLDADIEQYSDPLVQNKLNQTSENIGTIFKKLSGFNVPKKILALHKNILLTAYSAKKIAEVLGNTDEDPLKALLTTNQISGVIDFWQQALSDYSKALK